MKPWKVVTLFAVILFPIAVAAMSYSSESNEVEVGVVDNVITTNPTPSPDANINSNVNSNSNANVNSNTNTNQNGNINVNVNSNQNGNANVNIPLINTPAPRPRIKPVPMPPVLDNEPLPTPETPVPGTGIDAGPIGGTPGLENIPLTSPVPGGLVNSETNLASEEKTPPLTSSVISLAIASTVDEAVSVVRVKVLDNPKVETAANVAVAPALTVVTTAVATSFDLGMLLKYLIFFFTQPFALIDRRRAKRTGTVVNLLNNLPVDLATVRLIDQTTGRIVRTRVTDRRGRFIFFAPEGEYRIEAIKPGFVFSEHNLDGNYNGGALRPEKGVIAATVGLEPVDVDDRAFLFAKRKFGRSFKHGLSMFSTLGAGFAVAVSPNWWTGVNLTVQIILVLIIEKLALRKTVARPGVVKNENGKSVKAVVRLFETTYNKLVETVLTDSNGNFAFLVGNGKYYITAEAEGCKPFKTEVFDFSLGDKEQIIAPKLVLSKFVPGA